MFLENLADEIRAAEYLELLRFLACSDKARGNIQFPLNRHCHTSLARPIELGDDDTGERNSPVEFAGLIERIAPSGGINHEKSLVRSVFILFSKDAINLSKFLHQVVTGVQPPSSVAYQNLRPVADSLLVSRVADRCRICIGGPLDQWDS